MLISGSKHPKNIYNMSLLEKELKIQIKFEFKFNLEIKQKKKIKRKGKKTVAQPTWAGFVQRAQHLLLGPQGQSPLGQADAKQKKEIGPSPFGPGPWPLPLPLAQATSAPGSETLNPAQH